MARDMQKLRRRWENQKRKAARAQDNLTLAQERLKYHLAAAFPVGSIVSVTRAHSMLRVMVLRTPYVTTDFRVRNVETGKEYNLGCGYLLDGQRQS